MANTLFFDEGAALINTSGLPATCAFALSTYAVDGTAGVTSFSGTMTQAGGIGEITGSGYLRQSQARPTMATHTDSFSQMTWSSGTATDWPTDVRSVVMLAGTVSGTAICAANLQSGGAARDMSAANTTEKVTPTLVLAAGN